MFKRGSTSGCCLQKFSIFFLLLLLPCFVTGWQHSFWRWEESLEKKAKNSEENAAVLYVAAVGSSIEHCVCGLDLRFLCMYILHTATAVAQCMIECVCTCTNYTSPIRKGQIRVAPILCLLFFFKSQVSLSFE